MATAVLFISWNRPYAGLEEKAYGFLTTEGVDYLHKLEGKFFERTELIGLTPHGGDVNGAIILFGERAKLDELRRTDDFEGFVMRLGGLFDGLGVVPGVNSEGIKAVMGRWKKKS